MENIIDCYNKSGYPIPKDKFEYSAKQFDYWDMIGFAEMYAETIRQSCEGKADSTSGKDLRVCEVITSALMTVMTKDKDCPKQIPFSMLSERMAYNVHMQTLKRLNERGGMSPVEIVANIEKTSPYKLEHDLYDEPFYVAKLKKYLQLYESGAF